MEKKSQSSLEFIILIGAMLLFFIALSSTFQQNIAEKTKAKRNLEIQDLALAVQDEINLASSSTDGYERTFVIPEKLINLEYNITLTQKFVYIVTENEKHAMALPIQNVTGQIQKGSNIIRKQNGIVLMN